jgi:hypothetical protein
MRQAVRNGRIPKKSWPDHLRHPVVRGVFVGGCVRRGIGSSFRAKAHAHGNESDPHHGWICYRKASRLESKELALHEIAHLVAGCGHTDEWRRAVLALGGTLDAVPGLLRSYQKRERNAPRGAAAEDSQ